MLTIHSIFIDRGFPGVDQDELILDFDCFAEYRQALAGIEEDLHVFKHMAYDSFRWAFGSLIELFEPAQPAE